MRSPLICRRRAGRLLEIYRQFVGNDGSQSCFPEARRAVEQNVIECFAAIFGGLDGDGQIFFNFSLTNEFSEPLRTKLELKRRIVFNGSGRDKTLAILR